MTAVFGWGIVSVLWFGIGLLFGFTSRAAFGDFYYANGYLWPFGVGIWLICLAYASYGEDQANRGGAFRTSVALVLAVVGVWCFFVKGFGNIYERNHALKITVVEKQISASPFNEGYEPRFIPYPVAEKRMLSVQGDTEGSSLINVTYIHDEEHGSRWTAIADANSPASTTKAVVYVTEKGKEDPCPIITNPIKHGSWWNNIVKRVRKHDFTYYINTDDIYGDCVNGHAYIVIPLQKTTVPTMVRYPAGVAVINDMNEISFYEEGIPDEIYGPVYPMSLAETQRQSLTTGYGFWKWVFNTNGYVAPSDEESPNLGNESEFNLVSLSKETQGMYFVSPLTAIGSSLSLVGETVVRSDNFTPGKYNAIQFLRYTDTRDGLRTVSDNLRSNHKEIDWAAGQQVFEILPGPDSTYVGYVGTGTRVAYLFTFNADGTESYVELDAYGNPVGSSMEDNSTSVQQPSNGSVGPADQDEKPNPENGDACETWWDRLQVASNNRDMSEVLYASSQLVAAGCR